jgi:hypothetical protein
VSKFDILISEYYLLIRIDSTKIGTAEDARGEIFILSHWITRTFAIHKPSAPKAENTEYISTMLFAKTQVLQSPTYKLDRSAMRKVFLLLISLALLSSLGVYIGGETFATVTLSNTTQTESPSNSTLSQNTSSTMSGLGEGNTSADAQPQLSSPNMTTLQQPDDMTLQQQPIIGQLPTSQLSQQTLTTTPTLSPPTATQTPQQQFFPSSPLTSTTGTVQPQASYYPPSGTTFPPSLYSPSGSTYPSTAYPPVGSYPGTGYPMAAGGGMGGVSTPSQIIAPWFPSLPAVNCGGTFVMTVEGIPSRNGGNGDDRITASGGGNNNDNGNNDDNDDDNKQSSGKSNRRLAVQINSDNGQIITGQQQDPIFGQIFQGQRNIDQNKANDFDIRSIFNDCQVSTYSSLG